MLYFGSPLLQSLVGLNATNADLHRRIERDVTREAAASRLRAKKSESAIDRGGVVEHLCAPSFTFSSQLGKWMTAVMLP